MKKILLILPISIFLLNAEMIERNSGGTFISNNTRAEMNKLLNDDEPSEVQKMRQKKELSKLKDNESKSFNLLPIDKDKIRGVKKIPQNNFNLNTDDGKAIGEDDIEINNKINLKSYNVSYDRGTQDLSLVDPTKKGFNKYLRSKHIGKFDFKNMLNNTGNISSIFLSAIYYDAYLNRPDLAENFYKLLFKNKDSLSFNQMMTLSDYLLRTGRGDKIHKLYNKTYCAIKFKVQAMCFYYLGLDSYINTGNNRNFMLRKASRKYPKAKEIYYNK